MRRSRRARRGRLPARVDCGRSLTTCRPSETARRQWGCRPRRGRASLPRSPLRAWLGSRLSSGVIRRVEHLVERAGWFKDFAAECRERGGFLSKVTIDIVRGRESSLTLRNKFDRGLQPIINSGHTSRLALLACREESKEGTGRVGISNRDIRHHILRKREDVELKSRQWHVQQLLAALDGLAAHEERQHVIQ